MKNMKLCNFFFKYSVWPWLVESQGFLGGVALDKFGLMTSVLQTILTVHFSNITYIHWNIFKFQLECSVQVSDLWSIYNQLALVNAVHIKILLVCSTDRSGSTRVQGKAGVVLWFHRLQHLPNIL